MSHIQPAEKSAEIDSLLKVMSGGKDRRQTILDHKCMQCDAVDVTDEFRDTLTAREYAISGMCKKCQDEVFGCM